MPKNRFIFIFSLLSLLLFMQSCTEQFVPETETFENLLVVEATITNELKKQEIKLTRTYTFEKLGSEPASDAEVMILDNKGNQYAFQYQPKDSVYVSVSEFQAMPGNEYTLNISTNNGQNYTSTPETLPTVNQLSINTEKKEVDGQYGVQISVDSYDPANSSHYYRYEYSETYKVIAPYWGPYKAVFRGDTTIATSIGDITVPIVDYVLRDDPHTKVCYSQQFSTDIILGNTTGLSEDRVNNYPIRFVSQDDYILKHKYSILIKQYVQSYESYIFYKTLKKIAGSDGSVLSPNQPGFVSGNISVPDHPDEKVVGFFDVSSVSSERIFLEHETLFPDAPTPSYFVDCEVVTLYKHDFVAIPPPREGVTLRRYIRNNNYLLYKVTFGEGGYNIYHMVQPECSDCTTFSSNVKPDFWP